jgi:hypothetical protein
MVISGLMIFMANFGLSLGPVVWLYIPEVLEPSLIPVSTACNWGSATLITILFPILEKAVGYPPLFFFCATYSIISFFFGQKYLIETKGKTEKEIYDEFDEKFQ